MSKRNRKYREIIVDRNDVAMVLEGINGQCKTVPKMRVSTCGWEDEPEAWFVAFECNDKTYGRIVDMLSRFGDFKLVVGPKGRISTYFERKGN